MLVISSTPPLVMAGRRFFFTHTKHTPSVAVVHPSQPARPVAKPQEQVTVLVRGGEGGTYDGGEGLRLDDSAPRPQLCALIWCEPGVPGLMLLYEDTECISSA